MSRSVYRIEHISVSLDTTFRIYRLEHESLAMLRNWVPVLYIVFLFKRPSLIILRESYILLCARNLSQKRKRSVSRGCTFPIHSLSLCPPFLSFLSTYLRTNKIIRSRVEGGGDISRTSTAIHNLLLLFVNFLLTILTPSSE